MIYPPPISKGDCIGLVAPASPISREERDACVQVLEELGFRVKLAEGLRAAGGEGICGAEEDRMSGADEREITAAWYPRHLAGDARRRADDLNRMFHDQRIRAVFCVRGGYGSAGVLPFLDYRGIRRNPKIFAGYSDITAIHMALQRHSGLVTFHGPMVKSDLIARKGGAEQSMIGSFAWQWERLWDMIGKDGPMALQGRAVFQNPEGEFIRILSGGIRGDRLGVQGRLVGGNLSVLVRLGGTGYLPDMREKILFLEDLNETEARIHMDLIQLEQMGAFDQVRGILLGDFTDCGREAEQLLEWFFRGRRLPVLKNICSDHRAGMATLPLGAVCRMDTQKGTLMFGS